MRPIDADALREQCDDPFWCVWLSDIDHAPTIDSVPVVRCRDCRWRTGLEKDTAWHPCDEVAVNDNWFCADGERRTDAAD